MDNHVFDQDVLIWAFIFKQDEQKPSNEYDSIAECFHFSHQERDPFTTIVSLLKVGRRYLYPPKMPIRKVGMLCSWLSMGFDYLLVAFSFLTFGSWKFLIL